MAFAVTGDLAAEAAVALGAAGAGVGAASVCAGVVRGGVSGSVGRDGNRTPELTRAEHGASNRYWKDNYEKDVIETSG